MAEFDNFRKRTEKEKASMYIIGAREIVEKILPVVDNFERGLAQAPEEDAFAEGIRMIYKQLMTTLEELGVKQIEAVVRVRPGFPQCSDARGRRGGRRKHSCGGIPKRLHL